MLSAVCGMVCSPCSECHLERAQYDECSLEHAQYDECSLEHAQYDVCRVERAQVKGVDWDILVPACSVCCDACVVPADPLSMSPQKALETIGANLQKQYENWQPRVSESQDQIPPNLPPQVTWVLLSATTSH